MKTTLLPSIAIALSVCAAPAAFADDARPALASTSLDGVLSELAPGDGIALPAMEELVPAADPRSAASLTSDLADDRPTTETRAALRNHAVTLSMLEQIGAAPSSQTVATAPPAPLPGGERLGGKSPAPLTAPDAAKAHINSDSAQALAKKLGLDPQRAEMIIEFRSMYGNFKRAEDLSEIAGISSMMAEVWIHRDLIRCD